MSEISQAESLQLELEQAKQKIEELSLDLELIKAEMSDKGGDGTGSSVEIKQLEQQNARMKETLVKWVLFSVNVIDFVFDLISFYSSVG